MKGDNSVDVLGYVDRRENLKGPVRLVYGDADMSQVNERR